MLELFCIILIYIFFIMRNKIKILFVLLSFIFINLNETYALIDKEQSKETTNRNLDIVLNFINWAFVLNLIFAIVIIIVTLALSRWIPRRVSAYLEKKIWSGSNENEWVLSVTARTLAVLIIIVGFSSALTIMWFDMSIFMWWIWFWIWFTLKVFLTNFIAWIITVTQWTYNIWDLVEIWGKKWKIKRIFSLYTSIEQFNWVVYYVPNIRFLENWVSNYYTNTRRRVDINVLVDYKTDIYKAKKIMMQVSEQFPVILKTPEAKVLVDELSDKWVLLTLRFWINSDEPYLTIKSNITETINLAFKKYNIVVPYRVFNFKNIEAEENKEKIEKKDEDLL